MKQSAIDNMLVSVVIPVYNRSELLERAVSNVLQQTYTDIEVIVVDDGSEEDIKGIVEQFSSDSVRYIQHETNRGASIARNTGIEHSKGDYIAFLDSDDYWSKYKIERQVERIEEEDVDIVYCDYFESYESSSRLLAKPHDLREGNIYRDLLSGWMRIMTSQLLLKKKCFEEVGHFDAELPSFQEYDLLTRMAKNYRVGCVRERLVVKNTGDFEQISDNYERRLGGLKGYLRKHRVEIEDHLGESGVESFSGRRLARIYRSEACEHFDSNEIREGMSVIWKKRNQAQWSGIDAIPVLVSIACGAKGREGINKMRFYVNTCKHGYLRKTELNIDAMTK